MAAEVETMFYTREKPWHGLGTLVAEAPESREALRIAGLNWKVLQEPVYTENDELIQGYKANVRDSDRKILGVVTDRYKVIQNEEAFAFTDSKGFPSIRIGGHYVVGKDALLMWLKRNEGKAYCL